MSKRGTTWLSLLNPATPTKYDDERFPEFADCRDGRGVCLICGVKRGQEHNIRRHDAFDAADDATW